jgi:iron complex transport system permease protein
MPIDKLPFGSVMSSGALSSSVLLPASVLTGGIALTLADLLARTIAAPTQLPVGVITAFIGVPVFLMLLARSRS